MLSEHEIESDFTDFAGAPIYSGAVPAQQNRLLVESMVPSGYLQDFRGAIREDTIYFLGSAVREDRPRAEVWWQDGFISFPSAASESERWHGHGGRHRQNSYGFEEAPWCDCAN